MVLINFRAILFLISLLSFFGCSQEPIPVTIVNPNATSGKIIAVVSQVKTVNPLTTSPLPEILVELYLSKYDIDYPNRRTSYAETDSSGEVTFSNLTEDAYYLKAVKPTGGFEFEWVSTPEQAAVSYVEILFQ